MVKKRNPFDGRLSDQNTVEGIFMDGRELINNSYDVLTENRQFAVGVIQKATAEEPGIHAEIVPAQAVLDGHLP